LVLGFGREWWVSEANPPYGSLVLKCYGENRVSSDLDRYSAKGAFWVRWMFAPSLVLLRSESSLSG